MFCGAQVLSQIVTHQDHGLLQVQCGGVIIGVSCRQRAGKQSNSTHCHDAALEKMLDPLAGSPATRKSVVGIINLFVDDLFGTGGTEIEQRVQARLKKDFKLVQKIGNDVLFTRQRIRWMEDPQQGPSIEVSQERAIEGL